MFGEWAYALLSVVVASTISLIGVAAISLSDRIIMSAIAGAIVSLLAGESVSSFPEFMLPFTAGGFIYIAGSDLLPELQKGRKPLEIGAAVPGPDIWRRLMHLLTLTG